MYRYIATIILGCVFLASCSKEESVTGHPETITVDAAGYTKSIYQEGAVIIDDSEYVLSNIHPYFDGFEMLISVQDANNSGLIITDIDCPVYIIAPATPVPAGWKKVTDTSHQGEEVMKYSKDDTTVDLAIYTKRACAGIPVQIPVLTSTMSATPIARKINLLTDIK